MHVRGGGREKDASEERRREKVPTQAICPILTDSTPSRFYTGLRGYEGFLGTKEHFLPPIVPARTNRIQTQKYVRGPFIPWSYMPSRAITSLQNVHNCFITRGRVSTAFFIQYCFTLFPRKKSYIKEQRYGDCAYGTNKTFVSLLLVWIYCRCMLECLSQQEMQLGAKKRRGRGGCFMSATRCYALFYSSAGTL